MLVPYDGSDLSKAALVRAEQFDSIVEEGVRTITVIPRGNTSYARERGWIAPGEPYDEDAVVAALERSIGAIDPNAVTEFAFVGRDAPFGTIANQIRRCARAHDASIVFLGSANAGRMVGSVSVGSAVSARGDYDTMIVSQLAPSKIEKLEAAFSSDAVIEEASEEATG